MADTLERIVSPEAAYADHLARVLDDLARAYAECNGEDHPAYLSAQAALANHEERKAKE